MLESDPRVTAFGSGYTVATKRGNYRVLDSGALGWGVYQGPSLDLVCTVDGLPIIGAVGPDCLIEALLAGDDADVVA